MTTFLFWASPSGRLHSLKSCSGAVPAKMKQASVTVDEIRARMGEAGRPGICRCSWPRADRIMREERRKEVWGRG
jgi:hypothetical protein